MRTSLRYRILGSALLALALQLPAHAGQPHDHDGDAEHGHRQHSSHVHGIAQLDLVADGEDLHLVLGSPAANIVGFEHAPREPGQRATLTSAMQTLRGDSLFVPSPQAGCALVDAHIETPWTAADHPDPVAEDAHRHHSSEPATPTHTDIIAEYRLRCRDPAALTGLEIRLFEAFPRTERIVVQFVVGDRQGGAIATPDAPSVRF